MRNWIATVALSLLAAPLGAADKPNVVVLITDDQGYGDLSAHGNPVLKTPSTDSTGNRYGSPTSTLPQCVRPPAANS